MANQMMLVGVARFCLVALLFADQASVRVMAPRYAPEMAPLGAPLDSPMYAPETAPVYAPETAPMYSPEITPEMAPTYAPEMAPAYSPEASPVEATMAPGPNPAAVSAAAPTPKQQIPGVAALVFTALLALNFL